MDKGFLDLSELGSFTASAVENDTVSFVATYEDGQVFTCNQAFCRLTGYSKNEISRMRWPYDFTPPEISTDMYRLVDAVACDAAPYKFEKETVRKDGSRVPVDIFIHKFCDVLGKPKYFYAFITDISEHKKLENELKESEAKYRELVQSANSVILRMDVAGNVTFFNKYAIKFFGYTGEEILGKNVIGTIVPETESSGRDLSALIRDIGIHPELYVNNENENMRKDGKRVWVSWTNKAIRDAAGNIIEILCIGNDITGRKEAENELIKARNELEKRVADRTSELTRLNEALTNEIKDRTVAEQALIDSEQRFRATFEQAAVGIAHVSTDGDFLRVNEKFCEICGYTHDEFVGLKFHDITYRDDLKKDLESIDRLLAGDIQTYTMEKRYIKKDGNIIWIDLTVSLVRDAEGNPKYFISVIEDITERKHVEEEVRKSQEMLRLVMDNIPQAIFWKDINSVYLGCNAIFAKFAGLEDPEDIVGKTDYDLAWKKDEADSYRKFDRLVMDHDTPVYHIIEPQLQADGKEAWLDTNKIPMHDTNRNVVGILGTYEDITERKKADEELKKAKSDAEMYVDMLSHDIGNMNQAILGYLELALDVIDPKGDDRKLLTKPIEIISYNTRLIENVKKLSRIRECDLQASEMDIGEILSEIKEKYAGFPGRDITINYAPVKGFKIIACEMLRDMFDNIIENAIRHSTGPLTINIWLKKISIDGKKYYKVAIEDTGPGISEELKGKIFSYMGKEMIKGGRRGLGLHIVKTLADVFKGKLWVEDRVPGDYTKGARFVVILPATYEM
ncbi:hypothetical protein CUJ83_08675 [Methanocella sp. CWC-04]|uniref:histidine kinase n=1 Tax=Methanooceanicella nereidis TaxID=2052831 RepID=A0AAP2REH4_9EURY|nr:PAS domain S-box protein [Methanocella sp. CWC-04]MCD1295070.1 hypothetical protein [Methanocella sp. CWC-04]